MDRFGQAGLVIAGIRKQASHKLLIVGCLFARRRRFFENIDHSAALVRDECHSCMALPACGRRVADLGEATRFYPTRPLPNFLRRRPSRL